MTACRLSCHNLYKSFSTRGRKIDVLKGINFEISPGEVVVIKGRSGQGKSTLLWLLAGIDMPTSGEVLFEGISYAQMNSDAIAALRRNKIGLIFQNFNLIASWTALENVEAALSHSTLSHAERRSRAVALLEKMDLLERIDNLPSELSVGQQQRVALARALINDPALILADEPTGNVDSETAEYLIEMLHSRAQERKTSVIVATHGTYHGDKHDRLMTLYDGKLTLTEGP